MRTRNWRAPAIWLLCMAAAVICSSVVSAGVVISAERVGRVFYPGESVRLFITADCARQDATFQVHDYFGKHWYSGSAVIGENSSTQIEIPRRFPFGWYQLRLLVDGETVDDAFCVIPRCYTHSLGDDGLFSLQTYTIDERQYAAAAQLGIKCFRADVPWPNVERVQGEYDLTFLREQMRLCKKYGIQMMLLVGYTPPWTAVAPMNGPDDWVRTAPFTWHPRDLGRWAAFVQRIVEETRGKTITWPSAEILPEGSKYRSQTLPVVQSWELWNEADLVFYYGSWGRYLDMLRVFHCTVKRAFPDTPVIYGGSGGNWYLMWITVANQGPLYFDRLAFHPTGDVVSTLSAWYRGVFQLPWIDGYPRENAINEAYFQYADTGVRYEEHQEEPGDLYRIRTQLMFWNQDNCFRSSCVNQWIAQPDAPYAHNAMLLEKNGGLVPTPLYVAFAGARFWLSNATYVGPVNLGRNVEAHVLLKQGKPLVIAWSVSSALVRIRVQGQARHINVMGRAVKAKGRDRLIRRTRRSPFIVIGAHPSYLREALKKRYELFAHTRFGNDAGYTIWYGADELMDEVKNWTHDGFEERLDEAIEEAAQRLVKHPQEGPAALEDAMMVCQSGMLQTANKCKADGAVAPGAIATIYRLARIEEWLGAIADDRSLLWGTYRAPRREIDLYKKRIVLRKGQLAHGDGDAEPAFARQLLERAEQQLKRAEQIGRKGALRAAKSEIWAAEHVLNVQEPVVRRVFIAADFTTAVQLRKAHLLEADANHSVTVKVHNFTNRRVTGELRMSIPDTWAADMPLESDFSVDSQAISEPIVLEFSIPGGPPPWEEITPWGPSVINLEVPPGLQPTGDVILEGELGDGTELLRVLYPVFVGRLRDPEAASAHIMGTKRVPPAERRMTPPAYGVSGR